MQELSWDLINRTITEAGCEAHQASMDAHGRLVPVQDAYDFIRNMWFENEDSRYEILPETWVPNGFAKEYKSSKTRGCESPQGPPE